MVNRSGTTRRWRAAVVMQLIAAMLLTACGSTVRTSDGALATGADLSAGTSDLGMDAAPAGTTATRPTRVRSGSTTTPPVPQPAAPAGPATSPGGGATPVPGTPVPADPPPGPPPVATDPPTSETDGPVQVGYFISKNAEKLFESIGYDNLSPGNTENQVKAMVRHINENGGLLGRPIEPVIGVWDATAGNTVSQRQAACAKWFEDNHVIATIAESFDTFQGCATQAGVPLLVGNLLMLTQREYDVAPTMLSVNVPTDNRMVPTWVEGLAAAGYFEPEGLATAPVIGVLFVDTPDQHHSFNDILVPTLQQHGYEVEEWGAIGTTNFAAEEQNALLRFQSAGVTHVMLMDAGGIGVTFMPQAESQGYRPRYGLHSFSNPAILQDQVPPAQLSRSVGVGWLPTSDMAAPQRPADNATTQTCLAIMEEAGEDLSGVPARHTALTYCDLSLLLQSMATAGGGIASDALMAGLARVGPSFESALTFRADFTGRRDGAAAYRQFAFDDACGCFTYTSDLFRF